MTTAGMLRRAVCGLLLVLSLLPTRIHAQQTAKPVLHGKHWVAITGKPLAATAGAMIFQKGGNAVDRTSGPINAIYFDQQHGTLRGGSSHHGEDYGIAW